MSDVARPAERSRADPAEVPLLEVRELFTRYPSVAGSSARSPARRAGSSAPWTGSRSRCAAGEMLALVGESGCGKTTTAQTILRLVDPVSGTISLKGRDITQLSQRELRPVRRTMQMIYQDPYESLDPRFRVRQAIEEPMLIHHVGGDRSTAAS